MAISSPIEILDKSKYGCDVFPSSRIYFGKYPYCVKFPLSTTSGRQSKTELIKFHKFRNAHLKNIPHRQTNSHGLHFSTKKDLDNVLHLYQKKPREIRGPLSQEHLEFISTFPYDIQTGKKLFKKEYNTKISITMAKTTNYYSDNLNNVYDFLKENYDCSIKGYPFAQNPKRIFLIEVYMNFTEFYNFKVMSSLLYTNLKIKASVCLYDDLSNLDHFFIER